MIVRGRVARSPTPYDFMLDTDPDRGYDSTIESMIDSTSEARQKPMFILDSEPLTPSRAERILAGIIVNGDSVPELVMLTATLASENRRSITYGEARALLARDFGKRYDAEGEAIWDGDES
jgi:hypothetical protein